MYIKIRELILVCTIFIGHAQTAEEQRPKTIQNPVGHSNITMNITQETGNKTKTKMKFEDYMKKFEPGTIWEQIDKQKKYKGLKLSNKEQSEMIFKAMDPTDELMALKIENGDPKSIFGLDGRRAAKLDYKHNSGWRPSRLYKSYKVDRFYLRNRLHELMKHVIYTTRNKMVIMQIYRNKYRHSALYKMGVLFNKADNAAKTFGKFSFRAYRGCILAREKVKYRLPVYDNMAANERQMHLWFNVEILADLIHDNHQIAREIIRNQTKGRMAVFDEKFIE